MCQGSLVCSCHVGISELQRQSKLMMGQMQGSMDQALLGQYPYISRPRDITKELELMADDYFHKKYKDMITDSRNVSQLSPECKMKITGKEYLVVSGTTVAHVTTDLADAKKSATQLAHSTQGSVYIFQPLVEIAPKRDVVETSITLAK